MIDFDELYRVYPEAKNYKWQIHSYELVFKYSDQKKGLKKYYARIQLDSSGRVLSEIELPAVSSHPERANLIPVDRAIDIAKTHGFKRNRTNVSILYDRDIDSLLWIITTFAREDAYTYTEKVIKIDAHSAKVITDGYESGIK